MLRDDGIYAQNIIDQPPLRFLWADVATLREVFDHVAVLGPPGRFDGDRGRQHDRRRQRRAAPARRPAGRARRRGADDEVRADGELDDLVDGAAVLTDDYAPVDQLLT